MSKFYTFMQNNSGGHFSFDEKLGITHFVIIEGDSEEEAEDKAKCIGIYYDGVDDGLDCPCCGDRWYRPEDGADEPAIYGTKVLDVTTDSVNKAIAYRWMEPGKEACILYKDGTKKWV